MKPRSYQKELAKEAVALLREHAIAYLAWEERTGKSLTGVLVAETIAVSNILILTKCKASADWRKLVTKDYPTKKEYTVCSYNSAHKLNAKDYDFIILDEAHNYISSYPKPGKIWMAVKKLANGKPLLYMSATPHAQGYQMLYHQFALSTWSPWNNYSTFYNWFRAYGKPYTIELYGKEVNKYDRCHEDRVKLCVDHLFITKTRKELGFTYEPKDKLHYIDLHENTRARYNQLVEHKILNDLPQPIIADTTARFRSSLHMLEGGVMKATLAHPPKDDSSLVMVNKEKLEELYFYHCYYVLENTEKIDYILSKWGDTKDMVIMYNFQAEGEKLRSVFKKATVVQATSYAEGVDYTHKKHLIIYSQDYSTARHTQRRARQAGMSRTNDIHVNFLLVKKAISDQVYKTVSINKKNYVDSRFERTKL